MLSLRYTQAGDISLLKTLIHEFAAFERLPVVVTEADLLRGFGERPKFRALIAEWDAQPAGGREIAAPTTFSPSGATRLRLFAS